MLNFIKKNKFVFFISLITISLSGITFFTFIDNSFIQLTQFNLQTLLLIDLFLLIVFFFTIIYEISKIIRIKKDQKISAKANIRYITFFSISTLIPSIIIAIFSLFLFSFALEKYLDKKITTAVNNSYDIAKNYVEEIRNNIEADILLVAIDVNRNVNLFYDNQNLFKSILRNQRLIRRLDEIHLIDGVGNQIVSSSNNVNSVFTPPEDQALEMVSSDDRPLKIINTFSNKSAALLKLNNYIDTYLYVIKFLDPNIARYLQESEQAISFYYNVQSESTGIKISFAIIYLIIVTLLLFFSISTGIRFAARFFEPIANLIGASENISVGNLNTKVPLIEADEEINKLNKNFNQMIDRLKTQQEKLLLTERHEAWENVARKLAHEIKNPLTPIQLSIDRLRDKYSKKIGNEKENFEKYLKTINKQIKEIEYLVNEFSDFARMPKPIFKEINLKELIQSNIDLNILSNKKIIFSFICKSNKIFIKCDEDQINRVFINLIKNSIESLSEKSLKNLNFVKKINVEINDKNNYIYITIVDNGVGFSKKNLRDIAKPYFTTKLKGTGLGLAIVTKIINDHDGKINFLPQEKGAKVEIILPKNVG